MIKFFFIILIIFSGCSLEKKTFFKDETTSGNKEVVLKKKDNKEIIQEDFNKNIKIKLSKIIKNNKFKELRNNYGREEFDSDFKSVSKYKIKKIKNFSNFEPTIVFKSDGIIFFEKQGTLKKYDYSQKLIWKKNFYSKQEKKSNILLNITHENDILIITDNLSKYYAVDLKNGELLWSKTNLTPFNSQIKIYKDKLYIVDYENILHCFSIKNGNRIWSYQTDNFFVKTKKTLSIVIDNEKVIFTNSIGDITALDANKGFLLWQTPTQNNLIYAESASLITSDIVLEKDSIFFSNNRNEFYSINKNNGFLNWKQKINSNIRPVITDDLIFTVSNEGFLYFIDSLTGNIIKSNNLLINFKSKQRQFIKPIGIALGSDNIFLSLSNGMLIVASIQTGEIINTFKLDGNQISKPFIFDNKLYIVKDNSIIEYK
ncbi:PQQ-binding-like beta-propeller repeat protein [Candidatus Pelagibacter communis]|uniref:PQQ-binding-like beta-propeller repeat protein n=1 Tax=Pelagibacter ubique TaxID=198252 RepID=UPI00092CE826|nr:PQQ-binding-like beta-propeller repeat protein [Candidatus Pelagibacter ubique]